MNKAEESGENLHLAMLAYRVNPKSPGKLSPTEAMTQCKFRALLPIKQHLCAQLTTSKGILLQQKWQQEEHYSSTAWKLQELQ